MAGSFLRQSTASQSRATPPFLDDTDFKTAETALTIANTDVKLVVNGGASADKNSGGGTHRANGVYGLTFDATDTATVGEMEVSIKVAGALPVFMKFWVLEEAVYDALFAASAAGYQVPIWAAANSTVNLSATTVNLVNTLTTYTGNTPQTGDAYAIVNSGTHGNAAIKGYVDDIGTAGAGLTAVPWNPAWDAEVQSEVQDAIEANNLDHLIKIAVDTDFATTVHLNSVVGHLADNGTSATFDRTTDSLEVLQAEHDTTQAAIAALNNITAASVWAVGTRTLTAGTNIDGSTFTAIPWNASWDAEVQSECTDALEATVADSVPADGTRPSVASACYMICQGLFEGTISGTTWTIKKVDGSTSLFTVTLNDGTTPTGKTRAT